MPETFPPQEGQEPFEYTLLTGHPRTDGSYKPTEKLHEEYVHLTDRLVNQATNGIEALDSTTGEKVHAKPDRIIFLDKSARPVAWLMRELWPTLAAEPDGTVPPMPAMNFVNIDREQWVNQVDPSGVGTVDVDKLDPGIIRSLRSLFIPPDLKRKHDEAGEGLGEYVDETPVPLDHETVLIVDEVISTGRTLRYAEAFFAKAFPGIKVSGTHWMGGTAMRGNAVGNADLPVWYSNKDITGRGVGDRDPHTSRLSPSVTQRLGSWFLSTTLGADPKSTRLREEIHQLAQDVKDHRVLVVPDMRREDADLDERIERLNDMTLQEFVAARRKADNK